MIDCVREMSVMEVNSVFSVLVEPIVTQKNIDGMMWSVIVPDVMKQTHVIRMCIHP